MLGDWARKRLDNSGRFYDLQLDRHFESASEWESANKALGLHVGSKRDLKLSPPKIDEEKQRRGIRDAIDKAKGRSIAVRKRNPLGG